MMGGAALGFVPGTMGATTILSSCGIGGLGRLSSGSGSGWIPLSQLQGGGRRPTFGSNFVSARAVGRGSLVEGGRNGPTMATCSTNGASRIDPEAVAGSVGKMSLIRESDDSMNSMTPFHPKFSTSILLGLLLALGLGMGSPGVLNHLEDNMPMIPISSTRVDDVEAFAQTIKPSPFSTRSRAAALEAEAERNKDLQLNLASGMITGALSKGVKQIFLFPLDTMRVRMQRRDGDVQQDVNVDLDAKQSSERGIPSPETLLSTVRGAYAGAIPAVLCGGPSAAAFFSTNGYLKTLLQDGGVEGPVALLVAAAAASTVGWTVRVPFEVVKTSVQGKAHPDSLSALKGLVGEGGPLRLWRPLPRFLIQYLPGDPIKMATYEWTQAAIAAAQGSVQGWQQSACGSLAYSVVTVLSNPASVGNTRMILEPGKYASLRECVVDIAKEEGLAGLSKGLVPRLAKAVVSGAVTFGIFEMSKSFVAAHFMGKV